MSHGKYTTKLYGQFRIRRFFISFFIFLIFHILLRLLSICLNSLIFFDSSYSRRYFLIVGYMSQ